MRARVAILLVIVLACAFAAYLALAPFGPAGETFVEIPPGTGTRGIAVRLQRAGVIRNAWAFKVYRAIKGGTLHAGEYRFDHPARMTQVYARLVRGDVFTIKLVVPEGYNVFDIAQAAEAAGLGRAADLLAAEQRETGLIADMAPQVKSLEGFLFPDTYRFSRHATPVQILSAPW